MLVEKKVFHLPELTTIGGAAIKDVRVGWESYGTLNVDRSNAILVCHYFSGSSHAAGLYSEQDAAPGYWDSIIGPGKAIDTNRFFVLSSDTLVNLNANDPSVISTGPASIDPATGRRYGMRFPPVTIGDFVRVQKALVDSLGIMRLHAVVGPSMGGLQTYEWAASYPHMVDRIMPVIAAGYPRDWLIAWLNVWAAPIRLDAHWNGGDYYDGSPPAAGFAEALKIVSLHANHFESIDSTFGRAFARAGADPLASFANAFAVEAAFDDRGARRARLCDANHLLYLVKANQTFIPGAGAGATSPVEGLKRIRAPALLLYSRTDLVFPKEWIVETAQTLAENGVSVETAELPGQMGHLNGVDLIGAQAGRIAEFLNGEATDAR
jgi:homoserine O-acetyltransferase